MKSAYRSVMFYIGQKELEMQYKMNRIVGQCRQKCELMQAKFTEKLEEVHTAYQKMAKRCQLMEQENENLNRDKQELQEKFAEKSRLVMCQYSLDSLEEKIMFHPVCMRIQGVLILSRQKRKLDEMYDQLRNEYESLKRSALQPANNYLARPQPDLFAGMPNMMDGGNHLRQGNLKLLCTQFPLFIMSLILAISLHFCCLHKLLLLCIKASIMLGAML
jgi:E3 ubiquitin-protein ligase CCNP1IP1